MSQKFLLLFCSLLFSFSIAKAQDKPFLLERDFILVPKGAFIMGTQDITELAFEVPEGKIDELTDEIPAHRVVISKPFYLGKTEVTQTQWYQIMGTRPGPEAHWQQSNQAHLPVVSVSWLQVQSFLSKLNRHSAAIHYRLPTEAEWEYAARAGSQGIRPVDLDHLSHHAWYLENSLDQVQAVATRKPNTWGFFDMFGNVWEWVADRYSPTYYQNTPVQDPLGPTKGNRRVRRGGSYHCPSHLVRSAYRAVNKPEQAYSVLGFRLVAEPKTTL